MTVQSTGLLNRRVHILGVDFDRPREILALRAPALGEAGTQLLVANAAGQLVDVSAARATLCMAGHDEEAGRWVCAATARCTKAQAENSRREAVRQKLAPPPASEDGTGTLAGIQAAARALVSPLEMAR